jgi:hypothetical protein
VYKFHKKQMYSTVRNVGRTSLYCVLVELSHLFTDQIRDFEIW